MNYKCIKCSLKNIVDEKEFLIKINEVVDRCNKITINVYQFLKLFILYEYENENNLPKINSELILNIVKIVSYNKNKSGRKIKETNESFSRLKKFYDKNFEKLLTEKINYSNLSHIFRYVCVDIVTNINNNIINNFGKYIGNLIKTICKEKNLKLKKYELNKIKYHILAKKKKKKNTENKNTKNNLTDHQKTIIDYIKSNYLPKTKKEIIIALNNKPQLFLPYMIKINKYVENYNLKLEKEDYKNKQRLYQILPQRTNLVPKYIPIDTTIILDILVEKNIADLYSKIKENKENIWKTYFKQLFTKKNKNLLNKKNHTFNHLIFTDGLAVSILLIHKDHFGKKYQFNKKTLKSKKQEFKYMDELSDDEIEHLKNYKLLGCDPGKRKILTLSDSEKNKLGYSCLQRRFECGFKLKRQKIMNEKTNEIINLETELSVENSKTSDYKKFSEYIKKKNKINKKLFEYYKKELFRKLKWKTYIKTQQSEMKFINKIKKTFTDKKNKEICLMYGNWSQSKQMRHYMPTPGVGIKRKLLKHFKIITLDEFRTSKLCHNCEHETTNFQVRDNPKPYRKNCILVHSLLRCKNVNCNKFWDRDINGSLNILKLADNYIKTKERINSFKRNYS